MYHRRRRGGRQFGGGRRCGVFFFWPGSSVRKVLHGPGDREGSGRGVQVCSAARRQHPFVGGRGHHESLTGRQTGRRQGCEQCKTRRWVAMGCAAMRCGAERLRCGVRCVSERSQESQVDDRSNGSSQTTYPSKGRAHPISGDYSLPGGESVPGQYHETVPKRTRGVDARRETSKKR